ncbi:hypothetical protein RvY_01807 [Ramazzottius varieornatus]|uniref:Uncharacterized protein n=1 Tax=Ramazzottius varieornatus TaxID=947166 RepID=A0A1D1UIG1_RAMVA|nr:hypothetical protein RvY_01807 [Ramazzottius varieornatus]
MTHRGCHIHGDPRTIMILRRNPIEAHHRPRPNTWRKRLHGPTIATNSILPVVRLKDRLSPTLGHFYPKGSIDGPTLEYDASDAMHIKESTLRVICDPSRKNAGLLTEREHEGKSEGTHPTVSHSVFVDPTIITVCFAVF